MNGLCPLLESEAERNEVRENPRIPPTLQKSQIQKCMEQNMVRGHNNNLPKSITCQVKKHHHKLTLYSKVLKILKKTNTTVTRPDVFNLRIKSTKNWTRKRLNSVFSFLLSVNKSEQFMNAHLWKQTDPDRKGLISELPSDIKGKIVY